MKNILILLSISFCLSSSSRLFCQELTLCQMYGQDPIDTYLVNFSSSQLLTNTLSNQVIYVYGTFTVNTLQFTFDNCIIKMASGAQILISPGKKLTITNCKIFSCTSMWKEITVSPGGKLQLQYSEIEDGQYAVHSGINAPVLNIINNRFNRNHVSIYVNNKIPSTTSFNYKIYGNVFDCTSNLNSPYPAQNPVPAQISFAGVWLQVVPAINIGLPGAGLNEFRNQMVGILSEGSYVTVNASTFSDMLFNGLYEGYDTGIGISALNNSNMTVTGLGNQTISTPSFDNCENVAVFSNSSVTKCFVNRVINTGNVGMMAINTQNQHTEFISNLFEVDDEGTHNLILLERGAFGTDVISGNVINSDFQLIGGAINVHDVSNSTGNCEVSNNRLNLDNAEIGLDLHPNSGNNLYVDGNIINSTNGLWPVTIFVADGNNTRFSGNHITGTSTTLDCVFSYMAKNTTICSNFFEGTIRGLVFQGNSMGTDVYRNTFTNLRYGLRLETNEIGLGVEKHRENIWDGTCQPNGKAASHIGTDFQLSKFIVNPNNDPNKCGDPEFWPNCSGTSSVLPISGWFFNEPGDTCALYCTLLTANSSNFELVEQAVMDDNLGNFGYSEAGIWNAERYLYKKLQENPSLQPPGSQAYYFVQNLSNSPLGAFYHVEKNITDALSPDNGLQLSISSNYEIVDSLLTELKAVQEGLLLEPNDAQLLQENDQLLSSVFSIKEENDNLIAQFDLYKTGALNGVLSLNENIVPQNVFEANQKTINRKRILTLMGEALTEQDWDTIRSIANQCYFEGGAAVYSARALLPMTEQVAFMKNEPVCNNQNLIQPPSGSKPSFSGTWLFYPNPTDGGKLFFNSTLPYFSDTRLEIIDVWGKKCKVIEKGDLDALSVDISDLANGIFWIKASTAGQPTSFHKFVNIQQP